MSQASNNQIVIPSTLDAVREAQAVVLEEARNHGFDDDALWGIRLAMEEALCNAVRHGNSSDPSKQVTVDYRVTDDRLRVSVCDEGHGFKPDELPDPTKDENLERPNGRGVMLMKAYMTQVSYNERGNCVTMVKDLSCKGPRSA